MAPARFNRFDVDESHHALQTVTLESFELSGDIRILLEDQAGELLGVPVEVAMIPPCRKAGARYLTASSIRSSLRPTARTAAITSRFGFAVRASHASTSEIVTSTSSPSPTERAASSL